MTTFALPRDNGAFRQVYESLHNLRLLKKTPVKSNEGSTIFYTTFGEIISSVRVFLAQEAERKAKEKGKVGSEAAMITSSQSAEDRSKTLLRIAKAMGRLQDIDIDNPASSKNVNVYLSYLEWSFRKGLSSLIIWPQAVFEFESLSAADRVRLEQAAQRFIDNGEAASAGNPHIINVVGQARAGKSTLVKALVGYLEGTGRSVEVVDIGLIYRAYAYFMLKMADIYGESVLESEENILWYLEQVHVWIENNDVYLNGEYLSDARLHDSKIEDMLATLRKDHPAVSNFLQKADRRAVANIPASKWVILSSRGFYPHAFLNIFLTAELNERARRSLGEQGVKTPTQEQLNEETARIAERDRSDKVDENLRDHPGIFTVLCADANPDEVAVEAQTILEARIKEEEELSEIRKSVLRNLAQAEERISLILLKGGKRGGLDTEIAKELLRRIGEDFEVTADFQRGLTAVEVIRIWGADLRKMVEALAEDKISQEDIAKGLRYLTEDNGLGFKRWVDELSAKYKGSKRAKLLSFTVKYLSGNIRVIQVGAYKGSENLSREEYEEKLQQIVTVELRLTDKPQPNRELWQLWFGTLRFDPDTGKLGFVTAESKRLGIPQEELEKIATGVEVVSAERLEGLVGVLTREELGILEANSTDSEMLERQQLRDVEISSGNQAAVRELYGVVAALGSAAATPDYAAFRREIFAGQVNPVAAFENFIRQGRLFALIPEFKELLYTVSSGTIHDSHSMYEHSLLSLRSLFYIEEAARLLSGAIGNLSLAQLKAGKTDILTNLSAEEAEYLEYVFGKYKQGIAGLSDMTVEDFLEIVWAYIKATSILLTTPQRENDAKVLLYLAVLLHDIGKAVSIRQHILLGPQLIEGILSRFGFNAADIGLARIFETHHSFSTRIYDGYDSYRTLVSHIGANNPQLENVLSAILMMNLADLGGIISEQALTTARLRDYVSKIADKDFVTAMAANSTQVHYLTKLARQTGYNMTGPDSELSVRGSYITFAQHLPQAARGAAISLAADESCPISAIKNEMMRLIDSYISNLTDLSEILGLLPERLRALIAVEQKEELIKYYLRALEEIQTPEDLDWFIRLLPQDIQVVINNALAQLAQPAFFEARKGAIEKLMSAKGFTTAANIEEEERAIIKIYLFSELTKLSGTYKLKRIQELVEGTGDTQFAEFIANARFYYTGALLKGMSAESVVNFLYLVYRYWSLSPGLAPDAAVFLVSEEVFTQSPEVMDEKLKRENLTDLIKGVSDVNEIEAIAGGFGIALAAIVQNNQIAVTLTAFGAGEVVTKNAPEAKAKDNVVINPIEILRQAGWDITADAHISIVSRKDNRLNVNFARVFTEALTGKVLTGTVVRDLDKQFIWLGETKEFYILEGNIISAEVIHVSIPEADISKFFYLGNAEALEGMREILAAMQAERYFRLAVLLVFLPQLKPLLNQLSLFDRGAINREIKRIEAPLKEYVDTLINGQLLPVQLPRTKAEYPGKESAESACAYPGKRAGDQEYLWSNGGGICQ